MQEVKILSLWQPWASLVALKIKQFETRSWSTDYRGKLAIHASKLPNPSQAAKSIADIFTCNPQLGVNELLPDAVVDALEDPKNYGAILAVVDLTECAQMTALPAVNPPWQQISLNTTCSGLSALELAVGIWEEDRYAWKLEDAIALPQPIPYTGAQGLRQIKNPDVLSRLWEVCR